MDSRVAGLTPIDDTYLRAVSLAHPRSGEGPQGSIVGWWHLTERLELMGRAGLFYWRNLQSARGGAQLARDTERKLDPTFGIGLHWSARERWRVGLELDAYRLDGETVRVINASILYRLRRD